MATTTSGNIMCDKVLGGRPRSSYTQRTRRRGSQVRMTRRRAGTEATATGRPARTGCSMIPRLRTSSPLRTTDATTPKPNLRISGAPRTTDDARTSDPDWMSDQSTPEPKHRTSDTHRTSGPSRVIGRSVTVGRLTPVCRPRVGPKPTYPFVH